MKGTDMPIMETVIPVKLADGVDRKMIFNCNTMVAYEETTGKFFLDTVADLYDVLRVTVVTREGLPPSPDLKDAVAPAEARQSGMTIMRKVSMVDLRAMLWASLHEYNANGEPHWPLTLQQVGRLLKFDMVPKVFLAFINGQLANSPTGAELGESPAPRLEVVGGSAAAPVPSNGGAKPGGELSTELLASALG